MHIDWRVAGGDSLSENPIANGSHHYAALLVTCSVIAIYIVERAESSKFVSGDFYSVNKDLYLYNLSKI